MAVPSHASIRFVLALPNKVLPGSGLHPRQREFVLTSLKDQGPLVVGKAEGQWGHPREEVASSRMQQLYTRGTERRSQNEEAAALVSDGDRPTAIATVGAGNSGERRRIDRCRGPIKGLKSGQSYSAQMARSISDVTSPPASELVMTMTPCRRSGYCTHWQR